MLEIFQYPFMLRALVSGFFVAILLGSLGSFVVTRRMSLVGDGIAHASLLGIALALLLGWAPIPVTIVSSIFIAILIYFLERKTKISSDMAIAIIFTSGMALGIILLSFYQGYQPELMSYLFGNILIISSFDMLNIIIFSSLILLTLIIFYKRILFSTFDPIGAYLSNTKYWIYDLLLYISVAVSVILSIKLVGIILVSALLVTPSATAKLFSSSFKNFVILSAFFSLLSLIFGLFLSFFLNLASGALIVLFSTFLFVFSYSIKFLLSKNK